MRDSRRAAVYAAEDQVSAALSRGGRVDFFGSTLTLPVERRFADVASIQRYVDAVLTLTSVREGWPSAGPVRVRERAGAAKATYERDGAVISIPLAGPPPRWAAREMVILHELTHHLTYSRGTEVAAHGPEFVADLATVAGLAIGPEVAVMLRAAFDGVGA